jgi:peptidoglycan hydrolase-like protein with peptidoglycan-binding domain
MVEFAIDSPAVEALPLSGFTPETVAEGGASGARARDDIREQGVVPVPAVLNGGEAAATPSEPVAGADVDGGESSLAPGDAGHLKQELVRFIQDALRRLRYEPGPIDGKLGSRTASAIRAYQRDFNFSPDGRPSVELFRHLRGQFNEQHSHDPSNNGDQTEG